MKQKQHIDVALMRQSDQVKADYQTCPQVTVDTCQILLLHDLYFRGHDESERSSNRKNFLVTIYC